MNKILFKLRKLIAAFRSRNFAVSMLAFMMAFSVYQLSVLTKAVYIQDGQNVTLKFTTKEDAHDILSEEGIETKAFDVVDASGFNSKVAHINIKRAFPVALKADGNFHSLMRTEGTVEDLLDQLQISLGEMDTISLPMMKELEPNDYIIITRVEQNQTVEEEILPHEVEYRATSLLKPGVTEVLEQGYDGKKQYVYEHVSENGEIISETLVEETVLRQPKKTVILKGAAGEAISDLDFGYALDSYGIPTQYQKVLTNQVATGYSASSTARGASGMRLHYGYVATDPAEIPYGTKMYIATPDNSFVYGYAIAADTGIGLLQGVIDVDLYYETYLESCLNSRRNVNIYILE